MRLIRVGMTAGALLLAAGLSPAHAGAVSGAHAPDETSANQQQTIDRYAKAGAVRDRVEQKALRMRGYTGIALDAPSRRVDVYGKSWASGQLVLLSRSVPGVHIVVHSVPRDAAELARLMKVATAQLPRLRASGIDIVGWWPDFQTGTIGLRLRHGGSLQIARLSQTLGSHAFTLYSERSKSLPKLMNRITDYPPFFGGDFIAANNGGQISGFCSSAVSVTYSSSGNSFNGELTAGHCSYILGVYKSYQWDNYTSTDGRNLTGSGSVHGYTAKATLDQASANYLDAAVIKQTPASGLPTIWTGSPSSSFHRAVHAVADAKVGDLVCTNGAFEGTVCTGVVQSYEYDGCQVVSGDPGYTVCASYEAVAPSGTIVVGGGDSGGSVFQGTPDGGVNAVGVISAGTNELKCVNYAWRNTPANDCGHIVVYVDLGAILGWANARLKTS